MQLHLSLVLLLQIFYSCSVVQGVKIKLGGSLIEEGGILITSEDFFVNVTVLLNNDDGTAITRDAFFDRSGHNENTTTPWITLSNSTFFLRENFTLQNTTDVAWNTIILANPVITPIEAMLFNIDFDTSYGQLRYSSILYRSHSEPILSWFLGDVYTGDPTADSIQYLRVTSPCANTMQLILPVYDSPKSEHYLGVTLTEYASKIIWYKLPASAFCSAGKSCTSLKILRMLLTNHYLIFLSDQGLHVSEDLRTGNNTQIEFTVYDEPFQGCVDFQRLVLEVTSQCLGASHGDFKGDTVTLTFKCSTGALGSFYSSGNFSSWTSLYDWYKGSNMEIMNFAAHFHVYSLIILKRENNKEYVDVIRFNETSGKLMNKKLFRSTEIEFPGSTTRMFVHPFTHFVYIYGKKIYFSDNMGYTFTKVLSAAPMAFNDHLLVGNSSNFVLLTGTFPFGFTKAGVPRITLGSAVEYLFFTWTGELYGLTISANSNTRTPIDTKALLLTEMWKGPNPLAILPFGKEHAFLFEFKRNDSSTPYFYRSNIGQVFHLSSRSGITLGLILDVTHVSRNPKVASKVQIQLLDNIPFEAFYSRAELASDLEIKAVGTSSFEVQVTLVNATNQGWTDEDLYKTIVVLGYNSILITNRMDERVVTGYACVPNLPTYTADRTQWYLSSLDQNETDNNWYLQDSRCENEVFRENRGSGRNIAAGLPSSSKYVLDIGDRIQFNFYTRAREGVFAQKSYPAIYATFSNWFLIENELSLIPTPTTHNLTITLVPRKLIKGTVAIIVRTTKQSLMCKTPIMVITLLLDCPLSKRLHFYYPLFINRETFLYGEQNNLEGRSLIKTLPANYRPPSKLGIAIPNSPNVYNADPSRGFRRNFYKTSKKSWRYKQCEGKENREECMCTEDEKYSTDVVHSDCRERVYRMVHIGVVALNLSILQFAQVERPVTHEYMYSIEELNDREFIIEYTCQEGDCLLPSTYNEELVRPGLDSKAYNASEVTLKFNGSELYHVRVSLAPGISFCDLRVDIQVYVDRAPYAYPLQFLLNFSMAILMGGALFVTYLYYLSNHHTWRLRRTGQLCLDKDLISQDMGVFPPHEVKLQKKKMSRERDY